MVLTNNYWTLCKIDLASYDVSGSQRGYREEVLLPVQQQFQIWFPSIAELEELSSQDDRKIQATLLSYFRSQNSASSKECNITAGLSLRCYISHTIVYACQKLAQQFGDRYGFSFRDLLYLVLTDDGETKNIKQVQENSQSFYSYFWEEILRTFNPDKGGLWGWTNLRTRCHSELTRTLWVEFGLSLSTPWGKLNNIKRYQMETLSPQERDVVEAFHGVYRRDRREQGARGKCPEPSESQLQEMRDRLFPRGVLYNSPDELLEKLKTIAQFLQEPMLNPTEISPPSNTSPLAMELEFLDEDSYQAIMDAIKEVLSQRLHKLQKSSQYSKFAPHFLPILRLIYCENKSQSEVARQFNMNNQSQVSRFLGLKSMLSQIRVKIVDKLLQILSEKEGLDLSQIAQKDLNTFDSSLEKSSGYSNKIILSGLIKKFLQEGSIRE
ncbi:MAG: hypothetical protein F6K54_22035 [Okeania sp. SIO3B5]|uniref:hypothetical protein n=1 Tax=Okeania sp. SIO3B5 TaxID=2607811 RepID=UPI0013FEA8F7|nr:hypothetical protein [Okeania sp. SIO3B5]NEO55514.1 hypothetical protein [Okeania sp. SIO3B5]